VPGQPTFTVELPPHDIELACKEWAFSGLPDTEISGAFLENLPAALALINSAGFSQPSGVRKICVGAATHTVQVVEDCWEVFRPFATPGKSGTGGKLHERPRRDSGYYGGELT
jgi:hypothetical protein